MDSSTNSNPTLSKDDLLAGTFVFQCKSCFVLVGDSTAFVACDTDRRTFTLKGKHLPW